VDARNSPLSISSPHRVDHARVSSIGQNLDSQLDALQKVGSQKIFFDKMTGSQWIVPAGTI